MSDNHCSGQSLIQEFLDSPDSTELKSRLHDHLQNCKSCHQDFIGYQQLFQSLNNNLNPPPVQPSSQQLDRIRRAALLKPQKPTLIRCLQEFCMAFFRPALTIGAVALVFIMFYALRKTELTPSPVEPIKPISLNLAQNEVSLIYISGTTSVLENEKNINIAELKHIKTETSYQLPQDCAVLLHSGANEIRLSKNARFSLTRKSFELNRGEAHFNLSGPHGDFKLIAGPAEISVLGTEFVAQISNNRLKISLINGKILVQTISGAIQQIDTPGNLVVDDAGNFIDVESSGSAVESTGKTLPSEGTSHESGDSGRKLENSF